MSYLQHQMSSKCLEGHQLRETAESSFHVNILMASSFYEVLISSATQLTDVFPATPNESTDEPRYSQIHNL